MTGKQIGLPIVPCAGGLATRFPTDQLWRRQGSLSKASNVRAQAARLFNSPGYEAAGIAPALQGPLLLVQQMELQQGEFQVIADSLAVYSVGGSSAPACRAGSPGAVAGNTWIFQDAVAGSFSGAPIDIEWSQLYGTGTSDFDDPNFPNTSVHVDTAGIYGFQLSVSQGATTVRSEVVIRFVEPDPGTYPPITFS